MIFRKNKSGKILVKAILKFLSMTYLDQLTERLAHLKARLEEQQLTLVKVAAAVGWRAGVDRTQQTPVFRFEKEMTMKIMELEHEIHEQRRRAANL